MGISAIYGTAVYGESRYGQIFISGNTGLLFSNEATLKLEGILESSTLLEFSSQSNISGGMTGQAEVEFTSSSKIEGGSSGSTTVVFTSSSALSADSSQIKGSTSLEFTQSSFLEGRGVLEGSSFFEFTEEGLLTGRGEINSDILVEFKTIRALTNAERIKSLSQFLFKSSSHLIFTNTHPYYSTWNGTYYNLSQQNDPSIGYLGLLYVETAGNTPQPYRETTE